VKITGLTLRGYRRPSEAAIAGLGELEREVMEAVWRGGEVSVREVLRVVAGGPAYTTVMTTLDRLYRKGLLERRKRGRAFLYSARFSREDFERGLAGDVFEGLLDRAAGRAGPLLACLVEAVGERDRGLLDELERLVREEKRKLRGRESP
jgi:predicted transcriptional regulator